MKYVTKNSLLRPLALLAALTCLGGGLVLVGRVDAGGAGDASPTLGTPYARSEAMRMAEHNRRLLFQTDDDAMAKSRGCLSCHGGIEKAHASGAVKLGCTDCHGGDAGPSVSEGTSPDAASYVEAKRAAHVQPSFPEAWSDEDGRRSAANPVRSYTLLNDENPAFVRFVNPGDLRVAQVACGGCHQEQVNAVQKSPMTTSAIFWAAAAYANGILPWKEARLGEGYARDGSPRALRPSQAPSEADRVLRGAVPGLEPLPRWQIVPPGEYFRAFERGGLFNIATFPEIGNPNPLEEAGRPDIRVSDRGPGTGLRVSPAVINLHKTRLNDPHLSFLGTNDHPGDYRSSGCTACHGVYANDRSEVHSGPWASFGHLGKSASGDPTLQDGRSGHPVRHRLTSAIPTSQCMSCHMHQPNAFVNTYLGYTMWDYETDGEHLWPEEQRHPTAEERRRSLDHNPEGAAVRGLWTDPDFLNDVTDLNPKLEHTQFADYHGHGWVFRAVYKRDRQGRLLDEDGEVVDFTDPERFDKAVHLKDIHLEKGMHCVDCHFSQDVHGTGLIHGEYGDAIEIECQDCHGDVNGVTDLRTSGPAAPILDDGTRGHDLRQGTTPFGQSRFVWRSGKLYQRSMLEKDLEWPVPQVVHSVTDGHEDYNETAAWAKTVRRDGETWGNVDDVPDLDAQVASAPGLDDLARWQQAEESAANGGLGTMPRDENHQGVRDPDSLAHGSESMTCYSCHSSWITSCFGCHLPQEANQRSEVLHYEGEELRNYASYNPQVIRTDVYMLGKNGKTKGQKWAPVRSSSALVLSSTNPVRQRIYVQQPPISSPGFSSQAFNPHVPHTVRLTETKTCSDCHLSRAEDNNAWMAQLLTHGTGFVNFVGRFAWVALGDHGLEAVEVTEFEEPQAVIGSHLHELAYPEWHEEHVARDRELEEAHHHHGKGDVLQLQLRGEYLYAALGGVSGRKQGLSGLGVFDVANVDNKDFSEHIVTAPFSPVGQDTFVETADAAALALPTTMPMGFDREVPEANQEQPIHPVYRYAALADREEGLVLVDVATLTDGLPRNNFLEKDLAWNPGGLLDGARALAFAGHRLWVAADRGLVLVDLDDPMAPKEVAVLPELDSVVALEQQFRYLFAIARTAGGGALKVVDVTRPDAPEVVASLDLEDPREIYVARTYAYVAGGSQGLVIVDVERPREPRIDRVYDAEGRLDDVRDVQIGHTNVSLFAYVANGKGGLAVLQLTSPEHTPGFLGFSPRPDPVPVAWKHTHGEAVALSRGLDRDRAVDETGHQVSIFNRIGARPPNLEEIRRLYLRDGEVYRVGDEPPSPTDSSTQTPSDSPSEGHRTGDAP